jgi:methionyl aminopeptidase
VIEEHGLRPIRNLCGHGVGRWIVHGPPPIPSQPEASATARLAPGSTVAIEVFATDGEGTVAEDGRARIFRVDPRALPEDIDRRLAAGLGALHGLPFAPHQIADFPRDVLGRALTRLAELGRARAYRPLVERPGALVAQAEHTIHVHSDEIEVLT